MKYLSFLAAFLLLTTFACNDNAEVRVPNAPNAPNAPDAPNAPEAPQRKLTQEDLERIQNSKPALNAQQMDSLNNFLKQKEKMPVPNPKLPN
jgi:maltose-binding protein MalE